MDNKEEKKDIIDGARLRLRRMTVEDTPDVLMWRNKELVKVLTHRCKKLDENNDAK